MTFDFGKSHLMLQTYDGNHLASETPSLVATTTASGQKRNGQMMQRVCTEKQFPI